MQMPHFAREDLLEESSKRDTPHVSRTTIHICRYRLPNRAQGGALLAPDYNVWICVLANLRHMSPG